ncbi:hypothetical protein [Nonomuraea angiospora]
MAEQLAADLDTLRDMIGDLQGHIERRAAELAAPHIAEAGVTAGREVADARAKQQRAEDLVTELRRRVTALQRRDEAYRERVDAAEAIIRAQNAATAVELEVAYCAKYGVDLGCTD